MSYSERKILKMFTVPAGYSVPWSLGLPCLTMSIVVAIWCIPGWLPLSAQDVVPSDSSPKAKLDRIRTYMLTGSTKEARAAASELKAIAETNLTSTEREQWLRLSREAAVRLGDADTLNKLRNESDPFETQIIYRVLLASGQLEKGELDIAEATLNELGDLDGVNEREKRRVFAIRARIALLRGDLVRERENIEAIVDHLDRWPTDDCQSCHNQMANPKLVTTLPIGRLWFTERFVELMQLQHDAEKVRESAQSDLDGNSRDDKARIRLAFALEALGQHDKAKKLLDELTWVEKNGMPVVKPRMLTTFP